MGTDCTGLGSAIEATLNVATGIDVSFVSEKDEETMKYLRTNVLADVLAHGSKAKTLESRDAYHRSSNSDTHVDLYIAGFPCQPFSTLGARLADSDNRGK